MRRRNKMEFPQACRANQENTKFRGMNGCLTCSRRNGVST